MTDPAEARAREIADNWYEAELDRDNGTTITVGAGLRLCEAIAVALRSRPSHAESYRAALEAAAQATWAFIYPGSLKRELTGQNQIAIDIYHAIRALPVPEEAGGQTREPTLQELTDQLGRVQAAIHHKVAGDPRIGVSGMERDPLASHKDAEREPDERFVITRTPGTVS